MTEWTGAEEITQGEALRRLDVAAREVLGMSGEEFQARWMAGEYRDGGDPEVMPVAMLLPDW